MTTLALSKTTLSEPEGSTKFEKIPLFLPCFELTVVDPKITAPSPKRLRSLLTQAPLLEMEGIELGILGDMRDEK